MSSDTLVQGAASEIRDCISLFLRALARREIAVRNEADLQHELALWLRLQLKGDVTLSMECDAGLLGLDGADSLLKHRADIVLSRPQTGLRHCIELKYQAPRQGQYPERMFAACGDVGFLEQLVSASFGVSYFLMISEDHLLWEGPKRTGIYSMFRDGLPLRGTVVQPTRRKKQLPPVRFSGEYPVDWRDLGPGRRYLLIEVGPGKQKEQ